MAKTTVKQKKPVKKSTKKDALKEEEVLVPNEEFEEELETAQDIVFDTDAVVEEESTDTGIIINEEALKETKPVERLVKVCMARTHSCTIGGEYYYLEANRQYNVPENVKRILLNENLLKPL